MGPAPSPSIEKLRAQSRLRNLTRVHLRVFKRGHLVGHRFSGLTLCKIAGFSCSEATLRGDGQFRRSTSRGTDSGPGANKFGDFGMSKCVQLARENRRI